MATKLKTVIGRITEDREVRAEDFAPWSYNLHYLTTNEPWTYRNHRHDGCFEIVYVLNGCVEHQLNGQWRSFSQGDLLAIGEEEYHSIRGEDFSFANLIIPVNFWSSWVRALNLEDPVGSPKQCRGLSIGIAPPLLGEIEAILDRMFRCQQTPEGERQLRRLLAILFFQVFWREVSEQIPSASGKETPLWWTELVRRVEAGQKLPGSPRDLAEIAGMSREHVARSCRRFLDCSPSTWLNRLRLERAALLLRKTNRSISDIVFSLDYSGLPHFYRLFKERFGLPPGKFRRDFGDVPGVDTGLGESLVR